MAMNCGMFSKPVGKEDLMEAISARRWSEMKTLAEVAEQSGHMQRKFRFVKRASLRVSKGCSEKPSAEFSENILEKKGPGAYSCM